MTSIGFVGHTYTSKTSYIKTLTHTLWGVYQEETNYNKRATKDSFYIFGEIESSGLKKPIRIQLKSHAGHDIDSGGGGPKAEHSVVVMKYLKSSTFNKQFNGIGPILEKKISLYGSHCLVTRANSESELITRRRNIIIKLGFEDISYIDNSKRKEYYLNNFKSENVDLILSVVRDIYSSLKLLYFGDGELP